jgi:peptidoglycan/xylan/chitin deacetylase (PgdA/CDA1 family)
LYNPLVTLSAAFRRVLKRFVPPALAVYRVPTRDRRIYITFDDGPDPERTPAVLDILGEERARATFFVIGAKAVAHSALIRRAVSEGHTIGSHSQNHPLLPTLSSAQLRLEVEGALDSIRAAGAPGVRFYRPPEGRWGWREWRAIRRTGLYVTLWSVDCINRSIAHPERALDTFRRRQLAPGDIVLLHDTDRNIPAILPEVLRIITSQGWICSALDDSPIAQSTH